MVSVKSVLLLLPDENTELTEMPETLSLCSAGNVCIHHIIQNGEFVGEALTSFLLCLNQKKCLNLLANQSIE